MLSLDFTSNWIRCYGQHQILDGQQRKSDGLVDVKIDAASVTNHKHLNAPLQHLFRLMAEEHEEKMFDFKNYEDWHLYIPNLPENIRIVEPVQKWSKDMKYKMVELHNQRNPLRLVRKRVNI